MPGSALAAASSYTWSVDPLQVAPLAVLVLAYARRAHTLELRGRPVPARKQTWFYCGALVILLSLISPIDTLGEEKLFYVHMIQHLLLGDIGPLLMVLGLTGPLLRPLLALPGIGRLRALGHPLVALPLWVVTFYSWHLSALYQAALNHSAVHALEHGVFFVAGTLMWSAVIEPLPGPAWFGNGWKAVYTLAVRFLGMILSLIFIWSGKAFYGFYAAGEQSWGISPVTDQRVGGFIMFIEGSMVTLVAFGLLFMRWTREAELKQSLLDEGYDAVAAARAARYGRSALAQQR